MVSADNNNILEEGNDDLAFLSKTAIESASGISSGTGAPDASNPVDPKVGDIYVDETTGDLYTYSSTGWSKQPEASVDTGTGAPDASNPADPKAGDVYVDEVTGDVYTYNSTTNTWVNKSKALADNGLVVKNDNTLQLGGALTKPTTITADATNTLAIDGLQAPAPADNYEVVTADNTTGVLKKVAITSLSVRQYVKEYSVTTRGQDEFDTHQDYTSPQNVQAFRNGIRIDFTVVDANTIKLNLSEINGCFIGDEIRIVQLQ